MHFARQKPKDKERMRIRPGFKDRPVPIKDGLGTREWGLGQGLRTDQLRLRMVLEQENED